MWFYIGVNGDCLVTQWFLDTFAWLYSVLKQDVLFGSNSCKFSDKSFFVKMLTSSKSDIFLGSDSSSVSVRSDLIPSPPTYNTKYGYLSWEAYHNTSYYTRLLPPVPADCPLPMGTKGEIRTSPPGLQSPFICLSFCRETSPARCETVDRKVFQEAKVSSRSPRNQSDVCFHGSAFHPPVLQDQPQSWRRLHQCSGTRGEGHAGRNMDPSILDDFKTTSFWFISQVDASNIYGEELARQHELRLHKDGKLKYQVFNIKHTSCTFLD